MGTTKTKSFLSISKKPTCTLLVKVSTSDDDYPFCNYAVLKFDKQTVDLINNANSAVTELRKELGNDMYAVELFNYLPDFIPSEMDDLLLGEDFKMEDDYCFLEEVSSEKLMSEINRIAEKENINAVYQDATRLVVTDYSIRFSSYLKHTSMSMDVFPIAVDDLKKIKV